MHTLIPLAARHGHGVLGTGFHFTGTECTWGIGILAIVCFAAILRALI
jgi:hypothetical protein